MQEAGQSAAPEHVHALTVDVEEHFQVEAFARSIEFSDWPHHTSRVVHNTERILNMLADYKVLATFFIVGWVAEQHPELVRRIADAGHEIGCHSYRHRHLARLTAVEFREDTRRALATIAEITGQRVRAYRAPSFSVTAKSCWALEILQQEGIEYDSSVFPIRHDLYGIPESPKAPFLWKLSSGGSIIEFPASTIQMAGVALPAVGGGYLRILPLGYNLWALRRITRKRRPGMVYFHPWEIDPDQPRIASSWKSRLRHYTNLDRFEHRLRTLLQCFSFAPARTVLNLQMTRQALEEWSLDSIARGAGG